MRCAVDTGSGLDLQPMEPGGPCAGVVLVEPADVPPNPFYLTNEQGLLVSSAVFSVWAIAWAVRRAIDALNSGDSE